ncbi:MAG: hypothetical protein JXM69_20805 [Anaerolineae bacterium]|nr:hypothetical protein [Anaerolineae bacterium]
MINNSKIIYQTFHEITEKVYTEIHNWLDTKPEIKGFRYLKYDQVKDLLKEPNMLSAAAQCHVYFPGHFFKVIHTLDEVIGQAKLVDWLKHNPRICLIDIGCGAGSGTVAFLEKILRLRETDYLTNPIHVFCLGIDPNPYAIALYDQFLHQIKNKITTSKIYLEYDYRPEGIPNVTSWLIHRLEQKREEWKQPQLAHVIVMQVNVVSPLSKDHQKRQGNYDILRGLGVSITPSADEIEQFGEEESLAYKSIFETVSIDHLHVITVGTDNYLIDEHVQEMGKALTQVFSGSYHKIELLGEGRHQTTYINPKSSYFEWKKEPYPSHLFHVNVLSITNQDLRGDKDWQEVISEKNLQVAWAKTRWGLLQESFVDEVEIRLFENNLEENLTRMRQQLMAYAEDVARYDDYVSYKIPKNPSKTRPRGLSRMEEELLSIAIIQKLGNKESQLRGNSYAYRISQKSRGRDTEYLYIPWLSAYQEYQKKVREEVKNYLNGAVLRTDIKSFYTEIIQKQLFEATQVLTKSQRVQWLIRLLLSKNLNEHEIGRGIVQGSIGSGFYANIYLTAIDTFFGTENEWGAKLHRYVDDMIFFIPESRDGKDIKLVIEEVQQTLKDELQKLGLELNKDKTEIYYDISEFIKTVEIDPLIEQLSDNFDQVINPLWILDKDRREKFIDYFESDDLWWYRIKQYCKSLHLFGIYAPPSFVSRRIFTYLFNESRRSKDIKQVSELTVPDFPNKDTVEELQIWAQTFAKQNVNWVIAKNKLYTQIADLLCNCWNELKSTNKISPHYTRKLETRIRFAVNKLSLLGFTQASNLIVEILLEHPWLIREPSQTIEILAQQNFSAEILILFDKYKTDLHPMNEYLRAVILRGIRFLPDVRSKHWDMITYYALHGSIAERLMATETWLYLYNTPYFPKQEIHLEEIGQIVKSETNWPTRLLKNYILLIGMYNPNNIYLVDKSDDPMLDKVYQLSVGGDVTDLFEYQEPKLIRENFYSGQRKDDKGYFPPESY